MAVIELNVSSSPKKVLIEIAETNLFSVDREIVDLTEPVYDQIYQNEVVDFIWNWYIM